MFQESTRQLLRANQVTELTELKERLEGTLTGPAHVTNQIQDVGALKMRLRNTEKMLDQQAPKAYSTEQIDDAVAREKELREAAVVGMCTQEEMRRNPSGAVDKHRAWENRNKNKVLEWKNIRRRLHASGHLGDLVDANDVANFELFRPSGGTQELNMHGEQIQGQHFFMDQVPRSVVMTDAELTLLKEVDPELSQLIATAAPEVRAAIKEALTVSLNPPSGEVEASTLPICGKMGKGGKTCGRPDIDGKGCWQHKVKE